MKSLLPILLLAFAVGCSTTPKPTGTGGSHMFQYPDRTLKDWHPEKAVLEAKHDIAAGTPKIYISGTIASFAPGVPQDMYSLVKTLPKADAGIGCIIVDAELRKAQFEYARCYNEYIVQHLVDSSVRNSKEPL